MTTDENRSADTVITVNTKGVAVITRRATVTAAVVKVIKPSAKPRRQQVQCPLTMDHRNELNKLVTEWVSLRNLCLRPLTHGGAFAQLYSGPLKGEVASIHEIEEEEFQGCRTWLLQKIRMTEKSNPEQARRRPSHTNSMVKRIHARCRNLGISEQVRKQYQLERWGKESLTEFSDSELNQFVTYVQGEKPSFQHKERVNPRDIKLRVQALKRLLDALEEGAMAKSEPFDRQALPYTKVEIHEMLREQDRTLFSIAPGTFEDFWKKKPPGICSVKAGRRPR